MVGRAGWQERDRIIRFSVTSNGMDSRDWIKHFETKGYCVCDSAGFLLGLPQFKFTSGVTTHIEVLKGSVVQDNDRTVGNMRIYARRRKLVAPDPEVSLLIRDQFTDDDIREMGLWMIVVMNDPFQACYNGFDLLTVDSGRGGNLLDARHHNPEGLWDLRNGFAFAVPRVSSQN